MGLHDENNAVIKISFIPNQCQIVTLLDDNSLHLWSFKQHDGVSELHEEKKFTLRGPPGAPPSVTQIKVLLAHSSGERLYMWVQREAVFSPSLYQTCK
ncbi:unnamed protein product [Staurois parvus]|uniref:Uncharacterized protein n=1 Tax=Staurois parvus TaxID=386267 RepID=A0ABN9ACV5_9NEOB|nr:unnamed protein product [Staurois parvus]